MNAARRTYELQLERAYLRAMRAVLVRDPYEPATLAALEETLAVIERELAALDQQGLPMNRLVARLGLDALEVDFLWNAVTLACDPRLSVHANALVGSESRRGLSLGLHAVLADLEGDEARELALRFAGAHPLLGYRLLEAGEDNVGAANLPLRASPRLASYLAGEIALDPAVASCGGIVELPGEVCFDDAQKRALDRLTEALSADQPLLVAIEGPLGAGRRTAVAAAVARLGGRAVAIDVKRLAQSPAAVDHALGALQRECALREAVPVVAEVDDLIDHSPEGGARMRAFARAVDAHPGPIAVTTTLRGIELPVARRMLRVEWPVPETPTRRELWALHAESLTDELYANLALRYRLGAGGIERAAHAAKILARSRGADAVELTDLVAGVRNNIAENLGTLASRIDVKQTWDDLVLARDVLDQIHGLIARVRRAHQVYEEWGFQTKVARGMGVPALFSGPPGTGKTMVAGIIANELELELLQVDLSQVVSKWIGETEKQLGKVFDAAEAGHALLLFDEADSLFAKRTEVRGATDRYANLEVNYLLQRVEAFGGITILTTNLDASIDKALKRRLAAHVVFWPPDEDERAELWRRLLHTGSAPIADDIDVELLAEKFSDMSGANIRNAVLAAAFLASSEESTITQTHLLRAATGEYRTMGRVMR